MKFIHTADIHRIVPEKSHTSSAGRHNILIYATQPEHPQQRQWLLDTLPKVSIISRVEILGYHKLQKTEQAALTELLDNLELVYLTPACYEIAIQLENRGLSHI